MAGVFASCGAAKPHGSGVVTDETPKRSVEHKALHLTNLRKLRAAKGEHAKQGNSYESSSYAPRINCHRETATKNEHGGSSPTPEQHQSQKSTAPNAKSDRANPKSNSANRKSDSAKRKDM